MAILTVGIDLERIVFAVHGVDDAGKVVHKRSLGSILPYAGKMEDLTLTCALGTAALQRRAAERMFAITPTAAPA